MRSLEYRSPRVNVQFGVDFIDRAELFRGTCVNVSEKGLRASFAQQVPIGKTGTLTIHHPLCRTTIPARAVYLLNDQIGFAFFFHTARDHEALGYLIKQLGL